MEAYAQEYESVLFSSSRERLERIISWLQGAAATGMTHGELEAHVQTEGRELLRGLMQEHLDLRAANEVRLEDVVGADGESRRNKEPGHKRGLRTVFGEVDVRRMAYRARGQSNLHPADGHLNLPVEKHSHGLRRLAAEESSRGSFEEASKALGRVTGFDLGKRQVEELAQKAAQDFDAFYEQRPRHLSEAKDAQVLSCDGKGIIMRPEALRESTRKAASEAEPKLKTRLSRGEKRHRKRMAEVGAVYDCPPVPRKPEDILPSIEEEAEKPRTERPKARSKWLVASVIQDTASVVAKVFDEAERRDPEQRRPWVALVDGNNHQIECIEAEAKWRNLTVPIFVDLIHVLEYVWKAAWCFFEEGDPQVEQWVREQLLMILQGRSSDAAAAIRRKATYRQLTAEERANADLAADYLINKRPYLDYPTALRCGWPIATGVIEGACRHLVKDRMEITGARWGLQGAEAMLKLRALRANGDFDDYWRFHLAQEQRRVHMRRYKNEVIPGE